MPLRGGDAVGLAEPPGTGIVSPAVPARSPGLERSLLPRAFETTLGFCLPLGALAFFLYAPFYLSFSTQASGIEAVSNEATRPLHSALFWAPLLVVSLPLPIAVAFREGVVKARHFTVAALVPLGLLALWAILIAIDGRSIGDAVSTRGVNWLTASFYASALVVCLVALSRLLVQTPHENHAASVALAVNREGQGGEAERTALIPVIVLLTVAYLLILGAELLYIQDVFNSRLNSVFKLYYQAWLLLAIGGAFSLYWSIQGLRSSDRHRVSPTRVAWLLTTAVVLGGALLYPLGATLARTNGLSNARTLDGIASFRLNQRDDYAALDWLRRRAGPDETFVEATGGQYSLFARVAAGSGVPTVIGWVGHEIQWGRDARDLGQRQAEVDSLYSTASLAEALAILRKYGVTYVLVGSLERGKYPAPGLQKFESGLPVAFSSGQTVLYRVPVEAGAAATGN